MSAARPACDRPTDDRLQGQRPLSMDLPNPNLQQREIYDPMLGLDDKYTVESGRIFLSGNQALARLPMMQKQRDAAAGLNTAGFISGYRGSPLAGFDQTLWKAGKLLEQHDIRFQPGINEELAATAVWGSQQLDLFRGARYDGVFGMWYGKGPGVDRTGDVFKHANHAGTSRWGGGLAVARANRLDRIVVDSPRPRLGIVTAGKAYLDVLQALDDLGIDETHASEIGLRLYKVAMVWPLERQGVREFARGLEEVLVVEEKRAVIENQLKEQLYNWDEAVRPRVVGKFDERGEWILPSAGELTPAQIARVIADRIGRFYTSERMQKRLEFLRRKEEALSRPRPAIDRLAHFCSGCPHNKSTKVPEGSRALGGIGCHYMATWMDRRTETFTQMGGEGVPWIGQAPFTDEKHVFANLGDGTYFHSGLLAIRAAVSAGVNITYKILYNDAVAMTGGQPLDGSLSVARLTHQLSAA